MAELGQNELLELEGLLSLGKDALLVKAGEAVFEKQNIRNAFSSSESTKKRAGIGWWNDFRKTELCPFVRSNPAFRTLLATAPGIKVLERAGSITLALNSHFTAMTISFCGIAASLILIDSIESVCQDAEVQVVI
jgi:hypothetical protein